MNILYDLDGTISDPQEGITRSLNHALSKLGHEEREPGSLLKFIGPPLETAISELFGVKDEPSISEAIRVFRERYVPIGYKENSLYPGIEDLLSQFQQLGIRQFIATSKRQDVARKVIDYFNLTPFFGCVYGAGTVRSKVELVEEIIRNENLVPSETIMIGDRRYDIEAGKKNGLRTIGVLWGYGSRQEFEEAGADFILSSVEELRAHLAPS